MQDCASNFFSAGFPGRLTEVDLQELRGAAAILCGRSDGAGTHSESGTAERDEAGLAWPDDVVCISAALGDFERAILRHSEAGERVIVLAGRAQAARRQAALAAGAHDFLSTGPVEPAELAARIQWLNTGSSLPPSIRLDGTVLTLDGTDHALTEREAQIMALLIAAKGSFVPHEDLLALWGRHAHDAQYVRVAIRALRRRIEPERDMPRYLLSEPAIGYRLGPGHAPDWPPVTA